MEIAPAYGLELPADTRCSVPPGCSGERQREQSRRAPLRPRDACSDGGRPGELVPPRSGDQLHQVGLRRGVEIGVERVELHHLVLVPGHQ